MDRIGRVVTFICLMCVSPIAFAQTPKPQMVKLAELQKRMETPSDKIRVINFWATWCAPCIKELPLFEALQQSRPDVEVLLVSMDIDLDPDPEKVYRFVERKKLQSEVLILNEQNPDSWIDKIDRKWTGALPATLLINPTSKKRTFVEKELHDGDLEKLLGEIK